MTPDELAFAGLARQAELVRGGDVSPRELVELSLERIRRIDPRLNSFRVVLAEQALAEADEAAKRRAAGEDAPLLGVPIAVKDTQDVAGQITTHGTGCYEGPASTDSEVVRRLRAAGAIVVGKTTTPELATSGHTETETWGITRNPWDPGRTPGGSSGGSGAAVAAGLVPAATASDGAGSLRIPAANCGLFGLKPQRGRVSVAPDPEHWHGMSVIGCLARRVADVALYLDVAAGSTDTDVDRPAPPERRFAEAAASQPPRLRIALSLEPPRLMLRATVSDETTRATRELAATLRSLGHEVVERDLDYGGVGNQIMPLYFNGIHEDFERLPHPERAMRVTRGLARIGSLYPRFAIERAKRLRERYWARIGRVFDEFDLALTPTTGLPPVEIGRWNGRGGLVSIIGMSRVYPFTAVWNYLGNPAAAVPCGFTTEGLPLSAQLAARPGDEATLLSLGAQLEAELGWPERRPPVS